VQRAAGADAERLAVQEREVERRRDDERRPRAALVGVEEDDLPAADPFETA